MKSWRWFSLFLTFAFVGIALSGCGAVVSKVSAASMSSAKTYPVNGWTLHVDAKRHFPGNPNFVAHHFCRPAAGGITECQLYDSDKPDARLVGVEVIVPSATWKTFSPTERALWHYHKVEIPKVSAVFPDMTAAEAKKTLASLMDTYGKVYLLWDASTQSSPTGQPFVYVLK